MATLILQQPPPATPEASFMDFQLNGFPALVHDQTSTSKDLRYGGGWTTPIKNYKKIKMGSSAPIFGVKITSVWVATTFA